MHGWIKLHRQIKEHCLFKQRRKFSKFEAWIDILLSANHKEEKVLFDYDNVAVKRGEFITSEVKLADRWKWDRKTVRKFLTMLERDQMLSKTSTTRWTRLAVINWDKYQSDGQQNGQGVGQGVGQAMDRGLDTNKNEKNDKNEKKDQITLRPDPKDSPDKENNIVYDEQSYAYRAANYLRTKILENNPRERVPLADPENKNMQAWAREMDRLNRLGPVGAAPSEKKGYDWKEIRALIDWCQDDEFWRANILSPAKFREQIGKIEARRRSSEGGKSTKTPAGPGKYADLYE